MGRRQLRVFRIEHEEFPRDFPERLDVLREELGLSWLGLSRELRVNARTVRRWRSGAWPGSGHLMTVFTLAARRGLLHVLLPVGEDDGAASGGGGGSNHGET